MFAVTTIVQYCKNTSPKIETTETKWKWNSQIILRHVKCDRQDILKWPLRFPPAGICALSNPFPLSMGGKLWIWWASTPLLMLYYVEKVKYFADIIKIPNQAKER